MRKRNPATGRPIKISTEKYFLLRELSILEGRNMKFLADKALENYFKAKKFPKK